MSDMEIYRQLATVSEWPIIHGACVRSVASAIALSSPILSGVVWLVLGFAARAHPLSDTATGYWFVKVGLWIAIGGMIVGLVGRPRLLLFIVPASIGTVLFWFLSTIP